MHIYIFTLKIQRYKEKAGLGRPVLYGTLRVSSDASWVPSWDHFMDSFI